MSELDPIIEFARQNKNERVWCHTGNSARMQPGTYNSWRSENNLSEPGLSLQQWRQQIWLGRQQRIALSISAFCAWTNIVMANRYNRDHNYRYEDNRSRHLPRRDGIPTIRLLTEGAESIIEHSRRYRQHQPDQQYPNESSHFPYDEERNARKSSFIGIFPLLHNIFLFGLVAVFLILLSLGEFGLFYSLAMPGLHSNNVLHFDFGLHWLLHCLACNTYWREVMWCWRWRW